MRAVIIGCVVYGIQLGWGCGVCGLVCSIICFSTIIQILYRNEPFTFIGACIVILIIKANEMHYF